MQRIINYLYILLVSFTPLIFFTKFSESFELPKIIFLYAITILIVFVWIVRMLIEKRIIFRRTLLDIPLVIFLLTQLVSTIYSIDTLTSIQGYYSRFYGGLTSSLAMCLLYWAAVSNLDKKIVNSLLNSLIISAIVVSAWAIMEKLGYSPSCLLVKGNLDTNCWAQKVQERPFATLGQPNWLAAYLSMVAPIVWHRMSNKKVHKNYLLISTIIFMALLFTKSRSGILGFSAAFFLYWGYQLINDRFRLSKQLVILAAAHLLLLIIFNPFAIHSPENLDPTVTASTDIRLLLWQGALDIWKENPMTGTGPETFAYSYFEHRPIIHNTTSEWNFIYNKAHNEYLNYLANTGLIGLAGYVFVIAFTIKQINKRHIHLLAGYISLLVSNFFSFSVVSTALLFFLYPAFTGIQNGKKESYRFRLSANGKYILLITSTIIMLLLSALLLKLAFSDYLYAKSGHQPVKRSVELSSYQPQYWEKLGAIYAEADSDYLAEETLNVALNLAPRNIKLQKNIAQNYLSLGRIDDKYYEKALLILKQLEVLAPTDPMVPYFQALAHINLKDETAAKQYLSKALLMRPNYREAQEAFLLVY